ncbi:NAD(P)/FAD-dependent oxidoreductase [Algihabitans albus]|uniref:NAD(P)/FAD-dependent oxidoreductase n=1 Tax=Algihabitans albus TaxID=2164067 RepID=UPI000E5CC97B|nr:FAD-dependent oxidoreductase [Algihabitans albus]
MSGRTAIVIGAGIVGLATARALQTAGHRPLLIDPEKPGSQTSYGNAGLIAGSAVVPEARPGLFRRLPRLLLDPDGPLAIRPRHLPNLLRYGYHVARAARPAEVERISQAMAALTLPAYDRWMDLLEDLPDARRLFRRDGCLYLYRSQEERAGAAAANALRRRRGMILDDVNQAELRQLAPGLALQSDHAVLSRDSGQVTSPWRLSQHLAAALTDAGAEFLPERAIAVEGRGSRLSAVVTETGRHPCDLVVLAAGARSRPLARKLGLSVPLDSERGYHLDLPLDPAGLRLPALVPSLGVAVTPLDDGIRVAGLVEFAGLEAPPAEAFFTRLERRAQLLFRISDFSRAKRWMGQRPSLPDGLPILGRAPRFENAWLAFGHGQMGLTQAAATGLLIRDLIEGRAPGIDMTPYAGERFS